MVLNDTKIRGNLCKRNGFIMPKDTSKYIDHTKREIEEYLKAVKKSINEGNFIVCSTQKKIKKLFL